MKLYCFRIDFSTVKKKTDESNFNNSRHLVIYLIPMSMNAGKNLWIVEFHLKSSKKLDNRDNDSNHQRIAAEVLVLRRCTC